jgi:hypothetical protein
MKHYKYKICKAGSVYNSELVLLSSVRYPCSIYNEYFSGEFCLGSQYTRKLGIHVHSQTETKFYN